MYETLKYNFDVEDWAIARIAALRAAGNDAVLLISRDIDRAWVIVGIKVDGAVELAPADIAFAWLNRIMREP